jgi:hypothetical protein
MLVFIFLLLICSVPFDTLSEFLPNSHRGHHLLLSEYFWTTGTMLVVLLAYWTLGQGEINHEAIASPTSEPFHDFGTRWRLFVMICALPCTISALWGYWAVPESPRWLLTTQKDPDQALQILRKAAHINGKDPMVVFPPKTQLVREANGEDNNYSSSGGGSGFQYLFSPKWKQTTLLLWSMWMGYAFLYYGCVIATTMVFADKNPTSSLYHFDYGALFIANTAEIVGTTIIVLTVDHWGRIPTQSIAYVGGGVCVLMLCLLAKSTQHNTQYYRMAMVILAFGTRMFMMMASCVTAVTTAELLPTNIRTTGHSAANAIAKIGGFICPFVVAPSTSLTTIGITMFGMACFTAVCVRQLPETMGIDLGAASYLDTTKPTMTKEQDPAGTYSHLSVV